MSLLHYSPPPLRSSTVFLADCCLLVFPIIPYSTSRSKHDLIAWRVKCHNPAKPAGSAIDVDVARDVEALARWRVGPRSAAGVMAADYSAVPPLVGEAIGARAEIGWGASCRRTTLSCDIIYA